jgi:hypothetical protein
MDKMHFSCLSSVVWWDVQCPDFVFVLAVYFRVCFLSCCEAYAKYEYCICSPSCADRHMGYTVCLLSCDKTRAIYWVPVCSVSNDDLVFIAGRAIAQAVSCRLPTVAARVKTRVWSCGILWWTKVALGQVFSEENFGFPCQSTFHLLLRNHLHYHPRLSQ